jgi:hypothetical protein
MGRQIRDNIPDWAGGVVTSGLSSRQPPVTSPRGYNSILTSIGLAGATPSKRPGMAVVNAANASIFAGSIIGQYEYRTVAAGVFTRYHVYLGSDGRVGVLASDPGGAGTVTSITLSGMAGGAPPDFATAKNLCFVANGTNRAKLRGTVLESFGLSRPLTAPTAVSGAAGVMDGEYDIRYTFVNGNTNHESSASDSGSVTVSLQQISLSTIVASADSQTTKRRVYIRHRASQTEYRLAATINDNTSTTLTLNVDASSLIILGPDTAENDVPPVGTRFMTWWNSRMITADDGNIYWSKKNFPESFDPENTEPVGAEDGQKITGIAVYSDVLLIFKNRSVWVLSGLSPDSWRLRLLFNDYGCAAHRSIVTAGGSIYWWSEKGPVKWDGQGQPTAIGTLLLGDISVNPLYLSLVQGTEDVNNQLVMWTYPEATQTRCTRLLPFSYKLSAFVSDKWDPMDIASLVNVEDQNGKRWVYLGNYNGQMFRFNDGTNDGVASGTVTGTFVASGTTAATITGTGFLTTGAALQQRMVSVEDSNGQLVSRSRISSNSATVLTLAATITGLTDGATYTYYIGGPNFEWDTIEVDVQAFMRKRMRFAFASVDNTGATIGMDVFTSTHPTTPQISHSFTATDGTKDTVTVRKPVSEVGLTWLMRIRNRAANTTLNLYEVGMESELLTSKLG